MNLLIDPWIPVLYQGSFQHLTVKDMLCKDADWQICYFRDDMELAALQLLICLVQVILMPDDAAHLRKRADQPMNAIEFEKGIFNFKDMFILNHPDYPFMQTRGVKGKEVSLQKLFIGLPERASTSPFAHAFFNDVNEIKAVCLPCAAVALFQQATNGVSLGGSPFPVGLKGMAPITTLIFDRNLRRRIWLNVLTKKFLKQRGLLSSDGKKDNLPTWFSPIRIKNKIAEGAQYIGFLRGLFWQPAKVELILQNTSMSVCDSCGKNCNIIATGFFQEPSPYELRGFWRHPHSPIDAVQRHYKKFRATVPAWTNLTGFFWEKMSDKEGSAPALVVSQYAEVWFKERIHLSIGGYISAKEKIKGRRHEIFSLPAEWETNMASIEKFINLTSKVNLALYNNVFLLGAKLFGRPKDPRKPNPASGLAKLATICFLQDTEPLFHGVLRTMNWRESMEIYTRFAESLINCVKKTFNEITRPYEHDPRIIEKLAVSRCHLSITLNKLTVKGEKVI